MNFLGLAWITFASVLAWAPQSTAGGMHHASIMSKYGQLVTSSTLRWSRTYSGSELPAEGVPSGTGHSEKFICRAEHHGALLVGQTSLVGSHCIVGFVNRLYKYGMRVLVCQGLPSLFPDFFTGNTLTNC